MKMYETWKVIQKFAGPKRAGKQKEAENKFVAVLDDLFDIASPDALETMRIKKASNFWSNKDKKGVQVAWSVWIWFYTTERR